MGRPLNPSLSQLGEQLKNTRGERLSGDFVKSFALHRYLSQLVESEGAKERAKGRNAPQPKRGRQGSCSMTPPSLTAGAVWHGRQGSACHHRCARRAGGLGDPADGPDGVRGAAPCSSGPAFHALCRCLRCTPVLLHLLLPEFCIRFHRNWYSSSGNLRGQTHQ